MKTTVFWVRVFSVAVLLAPLSLLGASNEDTFKELGLTRFVDPIFPESLRMEGVAEGSVILAVVRNAAGVSSDLLVLRATHPKFAEAAEEAVRQWRFTAGAVPDSSPRLIQLNFRLEGVIIFPTGKNLADEMAIRAAGPNARMAGTVPALLTLRPEPRALVQTMPRYPAALEASGLTGTASVNFYVDEDGRVRLPEVVAASAPEFGAAAVTAVLQWRYEPPRARGRAVVTRDQWEFKFQPSG